MNIPPPLLEATNGVLWVVLIAAAFGAFYWLVHAARTIGSLRELYLEEKASLALALMFTGLGLRSLNIWWFQHLRNHGHIIPGWNGWPTWFHVGTTVLAVIGLMCWLRCTLPEWFGWRGWAALTFLAFAFGIGMAT